MRSGAFPRRMKKIGAIVLVMAASFVIAARGTTFCLCDDDPDDCGSACHECGAPESDGVDDHGGCLHISVLSLDFAAADPGVLLPSVPFVPATITPDMSVCRFMAEIVLAEHSPPFGPSVYRFYSTRLFPRS